ncbi:MULTISPECIES: restriction endonuclease [Morganellaceae]|uniref:Topoisomerase n=1 Tax=Morganella psychrotolerans TaxID=368603 RepID=A0A1B8HM19_9GAMM|nr:MULTISPECIES: restriction endonuclease [Morganellaceae]OBU10475.1 hypothetical protein AYY17_15075 [Morganella psychrotolerans]
MSKGKKRQVTPEKAMRIRFYGVSGLIIVLNTMFVGNTKIQLISLLLTLSIFLLFTLSGRVVVGTWFKKENWRTLNAPQATLLFRAYVGLPLAAIAMLLYAYGYQGAISQAMVEVLFPPGEKVEDKMISVMNLLQAKLPLLVGAFLFYTALCFLVGTAVKYLQLSASGRALGKLKGVVNARQVLDRMTWDQFEKVICKFFETRGYRARVSKAGADGGVDVELQGFGHREMVQCKHWKTNRVGVAIVREIYGVVLADGFHRGFIITSGLFTDEAWKFALRENVKGKVILLDGSQLIEMIKGNGDLEQEDPKPSAATQSIDAKEPLCPVCGGKMVLRKSGKSAFFGCSLYPDCRGTREL